MTLEQLFANSTIHIPDMLAHLQQTADTLGLPFGKREKTFNSRSAQELGLWAESEGQGDAFHMAAFMAYFANGLNIAKPEVLYNLVESVGLSRKDASAVLTERSFKAAVDADGELSRTLRISAVPTFVMNGQKLVGAQPYEELEKLLKANGVAKRE